MAAPTAFRYSLLLLGTRAYCSPEGLDSLVRAVEDEPTRFFWRFKAQGTVVFTGLDFRYLWNLENSSDRGAPVYLDIEREANSLGAEWELVHRAQFTLNEVQWEPDECRCTVRNLTPADDYQDWLEAWDKPVNLLGYTGPRVTCYTTLRELGVYANTRPDSISNGTELEFTRVDKADEADKISGNNGWSTFLRNTSWIAGGLTGGTREKTVILFRLAKRNVPMVLDEDGMTYIPPDLSSNGWQVFDVAPDATTPVAHYVKSPSIAGFKPYIIGSYPDWSRRYGTDLLLLPCGAASPGPEYVQVNSPDGVNLGGEGGANNAECHPCLNVRQRTNRQNCKSLWWRFGRFRFTRGIPLLEAVNHLVKAVLPRLAPVNATDLSRHFSESASYATGANATANELPQLLVSAASDVKRYGSSEPARKLLISPKQFIEELCTLYDCGWFIENGKLRIEHRSLTEQPRPAVDLTGNGGGAASYEYLQDKLPRREGLSIAAAVSEDSAAVNFRQGLIEYAPAETNTREDQNNDLRTVSKLTGDVAGMVLSADSIPDEAVAILAPGPGGVLRDGNRLVSASQLVRRYWRHGRVKLQATVNGEAVDFASQRPQRKQTPFTAPLCEVDLLPYGAWVKTRLSAAATLQQVQWNLTSGEVQVTPLLPPLQGLAPAIGVPGTPKQFNPTQFRQAADPSSKAPFA